MRHQEDGVTGEKGDFPHGGGLPLVQLRGRSIRRAFLEGYLGHPRRFGNFFDYYLTFFLSITVFLFGDTRNKNFNIV